MVKKLKQVLLVVFSIIMIVEIGKFAVANRVDASGSDIILNGDDDRGGSFIGDYQYEGIGYCYLGYVTTKNATSDYKYLQLTYTGDITFLRMNFEEGDNGGASDEVYWFDEIQVLHFVTADNSIIPLTVTEPTTIVIDLAKSGISDISCYIGLHMHYHDEYIESSGFKVSDARLLKTYTPTESSTEASSESETEMATESATEISTELETMAPIEDEEMNNFFEIGIDSNNFLHSYTTFGYKTIPATECYSYSEDSIGTVYPTSIEYYSKLISGLTWKEEINLLDIMNGKEWEGSCQGLSISLALANMGKLNVSIFNDESHEYDYYNSCQNLKKNWILETLLIIII